MLSLLFEWLVFTSLTLSPSTTSTSIHGGKFQFCSSLIFSIQFIFSGNTVIPNDASIDIMYMGKGTPVNATFHVQPTTAAHVEVSFVLMFSFAFYEYFKLAISYRGSSIFGRS
jgi:hypothetical protein